MAKHHAARSSRAPKNTAPIIVDSEIVDLTIDNGETTDTPTDMALAHPLMPTPYMQTLHAMLLEYERLRDDQPNVLIASRSDDDLSGLASDLLSATPATATERSSVPSATRYDIGLRAARLMMKYNIGVESCAVMIGDMLERRAAILNVPIPRVWRDLVNIHHALKCWLPGTVASASLPKCWPAATKRPFYGLPDYVVTRIRLGEPGYDHGGMVCDYWARIHPGKITLALVEQFDQLTTRDDRRSFLRELLNVD